MRLYEYEASKIIQKEGIRIPNALLVKTPEEAVKAYHKIGRPVMLKAQVLAEGREKAGGIIAAQDEYYVNKGALKIFKSKIRNLPVNTLLVQERIEIVKEIYLGLTIDRSKRKIAVIESSKGGMDIEQLAYHNPELIIKDYFDPLEIPNVVHAAKIAAKIGFRKEETEKLTYVLLKMHQIFLRLDCELLEINPLALTMDGMMVALHPRMVIDDNALFRHPELQAREDDREMVEIKAAQKGLNYVKLDGNIGVIGNGAGLVMATLDLVVYFGGRPANFCDVGGGAKAQNVAEAVKIVLSQRGIKVLLLNIIGGITSCSDVANGLVDALNTVERNIPIVVRLAGSEEKVGQSILRSNGLMNTISMEKAVKEAITIARGE